MDISEIDIKTFKEMFPREKRNLVNENILEIFKNLTSEPDYGEFFRDNILTYMSVLSDGRYKITDYFYAVKYVSYKLLNDTNRSAYAKTFPDRMKKLLEKVEAGQYSDKDVNSVISAYAKGHIVTKIFEKTIIPSSIVYRDAFHQAVNVQMDLMVNARSETVQQKASLAIIEHFKPKEDERIELDISVKESEPIIEQYQNALHEAAKRMQEMMKNGYDVKDTANIPLTIKKDIIEVTEKES